jgi:hypothetical protein
MTLTKVSGNIIGAHQKIDRIARKELELLLPGLEFPDISTILKFEGLGGPDGIKRKSPAKDEPWHYIDPYDLKDNQLIEQIRYHYQELVSSLKGTNDVRAAFEAAWLAHALVDGLTPAHHFPYEEKLKEVGADLESRNTIKDKIVMPGETRSEAVKNNWKFWGPKGITVTHFSFELGFATLIAPLSFAEKLFPKKLIEKFTSESLNIWFRDLAQKVALLHIYDDFYKSGWNLKTTRKVKNKLAPLLIDAVTTVWYCAYSEAKYHQ